MLVESSSHTFEMEEDQELKFVCKLCNKKYPCGKSLGGHMRSHVVANSIESEAKLTKILSYGDEGDEQKRLLKESKFYEFENGQSSYGLRENPRKTWRASDTPLSLQLKVCKQCGKGFQSMKALCGHMACHSEKDRGMKDDHSWTSENQKLVIDSCSDTEKSEEMRIRTRSSKSKRYKKVAVKSPFTLANNGSSSVSEIDEQETEEVAISLMLLSRDSGNKGCAYSVVESSDNNSVVLETKSSSIDMKTGDKGEGLKKIGDMKLKASELDAEIAQMENSDSGYFLDECAKAESDVSVDGKYHAFDDYKKYLVNVKGRNEDSELRENFRRMKNCRTEISKQTKRIEYDDNGTKSRKRKYGSENPDSWNEYNRIVNNGTSQKRSKYECFNCKKTFKSYQALGGHRPCHKKSNAFHELRYEDGESSLYNSTDYRTNGKHIESSTNKKSSAKSSSPVANKTIELEKKKEHICPFCNRVFKNGQALGGHKRSHFIGGHEETSNHIPVEKPELRKRSHFIVGHEETSNHIPMEKPELRKRSHFVGGHEETSNHIPVEKPELRKQSHLIGGHEETSNHIPVEKPELRDLLDLNLPAPEEDENDGGDQLFSW